MNDPHKDPNRMAVTLTVAELTEIIEAAVERAIAKKKPAQLLFDTSQAASMLGLSQSWLARQARLGNVPYRQAGHYRLFSLQDIEAIMEKFAVPKKQKE